MIGLDLASGRRRPAGKVGLGRLETVVRRPEDGLGLGRGLGQHSQVSSDVIEARVGRGWRRWQGDQRAASDWGEAWVVVDAGPDLGKEETVNVSLGSLRLEMMSR